jgi:hypothetical protein
MSRIFRNIRKKYLNGKKIRQYVIYALGEIFLVVVGILLALYLNDLNSEKKSERENFRLVTDLEKGLTNSQFLMGRFASRVYNQDSIIEAVIYNRLSDGIGRSNRILTELMTPGTQYTWLDDENIITLLQKERDFSPTYNRLFKLIKNYKSRLDDLDYAVKEMNDLSNWNDQLIAQDFEWFSGTEKTDQEKKVAFYLTDPFYKNRLVLYRKKLGNQISHITALNALRAAMMGEIRMLKGEENIDWTSYFQSFGLKNLAPVACESSEIDWERTFPFFNYYLFFNNTAQAKTVLRLRDHVGSWEEYLIDAGEFEILPQFPGMGFMLNTSDHCEQLYIAPKGGFLVIE